MKMQSVKLEDGTSISLETNSTLGKGGEGTVYAIQSPSSYARSHCIKIYTDATKAAKLEAKVRYMTKHIPAVPHFVRLCWPEAIVLHRGKFVGYLMPLALENSRNMAELEALNFQRRKQLPQAFKDKYNRDTIDGLESRLKLSVNIAAAYHAVHLSQRYTIVDMKPDNILVTVDAKVSVVDCDSFQISENGKILFPAAVVTEEYAPPHTKNTSKDIYWDYFSYAVLVYKLIFGVHPYAATAKSPYNNATDIVSKIDQDLFVFGSKSKFIEKLDTDNPHQKFKRLPVILQNLFIQVFDKDEKHAKQRTSMEKFGQTIYNILRAADKKKVLNDMLHNTGYINKIPQYELYWYKLLRDPLDKKELLLYWYAITALLTAIMYFVHTLFQSHGFFSFIGHVISGTIVGVFTGVLWPIVLLFNSSNAWAIIFTLITSAMILYRLKFYTMFEKKYFYIFSGGYGLITLLLLMRYFNM